MIKKAADAYRRTKLTPRTQTFLKFLTKFSWTGNLLCFYLI
jgi:hypothetical protein